MSIADTARNLARLDLAAVRAAALAAAAATIAEAVREALAPSPLADSIESSADGDGALIGSTAEVALYQEVGTATMPPRPFLAPIAAEQADAVVSGIGAAIATAIRDAS